MPENSPILHRRILAMFFLVHGVLAVALIWGRLGADGTLDRLQEASNDRHYQLPETTSPLPQAYTGLYPIDRTLRTVIILFWGAIDGLSPATTTAALYFAGQMFPIASSIFLDGLRVGNGAGMVKTALWYELIGLLAIGCVGPMWGYMHVRSSATFSPANTLEALQAASLLASPRKAILLLPALVVTFLGPLVVMGLPSVIYAQRAIIIWNLFPVILVPLVRGGQLLWDALSPTPLTADLALAKRQHQQAHLLAVRWLGTASFLIGFATHFAIGALSVSALLFPFMFAESYAHDLHPFRLFLPPLSIRQTTKVSDGLLGFMLWDQMFGYSAVLVVFVLQLQRAIQSKRAWVGDLCPLRVSALTVLGSLLCGPGTTVMGISWLRDEILYQQECTGEGVVCE